MSDDTNYTMRECAIAMHELYLSYIDAGFTDDQAFDLIKAAVQPRS